MKENEGTSKQNADQKKVDKLAANTPAVTPKSGSLQLDMYGLIYLFKTSYTYFPYTT